MRCGHLPGLDPESVTWTDLGARQPDWAGVLVPVLSPEQIEQVTAKVRVQAALHLRPMPLADIIDRIDRAVARLLDPQDPVRQQLEDVLPRVCGLDAEMVRLNLNRTLKTYRASGLYRFVNEDLSNPLMLDRFQPLPKGGWGQVLGPQQLVHLWAGNVPGLSLWSLVCGLLVKAGNVGKLATAEPVFATLFVQVLIDIEPRWREALALLWYEGGDAAPEAAAWAQAQCVIAYGSDETLQALRERVPNSVRFLAHGHKLSFGVLGASALSARHGPEWALAAAQDVVRYEQGGCYSPHVYFVQRGGRVSPLEWAERLFHALQNLHARHPRRQPQTDEAMACARWRQNLEWSGQAQLMTGAGGDVAYLERATPLSPGPGLRSVQVMAFDTPDELLACVTPARQWLQTAALALTPEEWPDWAHRLGLAGVTRLCAIGAMSAPEAGWHHDGGHSLRDFLTWVEVEQSLQDAAERHAPYAD